MQVTRTFDLLEQYNTLFNDKPDALAGKENGKWVKYSASQYVANANAISSGLLASGLTKGDKVATITNNRPEWNFVDMGLAQIGVLHVPLFTNLTPEGYKNILNHAEVKVVFVSDEQLLKTIESIRHEVPSLMQVYTFDEVSSANNWKEVLEEGQSRLEEFRSQIEEIKNETTPEEAVTLIYTSGTTGNSKGVLLSHKNLISNAESLAKVFQLQKDERYLSILPICHVGERIGNYQTQLSGCSIYYVESLATIANDLQDVKPQGFGAVPRILERVYDKIISKGQKLSGVKKKLFFWALDLGLKYDPNNGAWYKFQLAIARKLIFSKWQAAMGGNVKVVGVGGAALQPRLEKVFWAAGIRLLNMYGLTETSPTITMNRNGGDQFKLGTVGTPIDNVEVKIASDGEILCKGPNVMIGYYKDEQATSEAIKDGWFHTGDIGVFEDGFLRVTDRKKEIFKLSNGKYVAPIAIENLFKESVYIDQLMVLGDGEKFTSALISPNFEALIDWSKSNGIEFAQKEDLIQKAEVQKLYNEICEELNKSLGQDERIKRFRLVSDEWTPESGELSPTLKLKRRIIQEKYQHVIDRIFGHTVESQ